MRILRGDVKPGEGFPHEEALSEQLGVSRTVVREALKVLQAKGLVASKPKIGTLVRQPRDWNLLDAQVLQWRYEANVDEQLLHDLTEVRWIIEPAAARLAAVRATPDQIDAMQHWYTQMDAHLSDDEDFINADMEFHMAILEASGNEILHQMHRTINLVLRISRKVTVGVPGSSEASMPLHLAVIEAIRSRDSDIAEAQMSKLLKRTAHDINLAAERHQLSPLQTFPLANGGVADQ
jgi:GntR family transcriptional regulator, galactonate operon transcriptional repressor